jgi:DeoR/GlpR family transcriptional regulator of sugar metabolism
MLIAKRQARIVSMVRAAQYVSTETLAREFDVSNETIRRDLLQLERNGVLHRVHGGAASAESRPIHEPSFERRTQLATAEKTRIGQAAAKLVRSGQTIVIDVGTTALAVAHALPADLEGTVVTNSLLVANELAGRRGLDVVVACGRLRVGDMALSNVSTTEFFSKIWADIAFVASGGLHADVGLTGYHMDEVAVRQQILLNSARSYVLADSEKFGRLANYKVADLDILTSVIADRAPEGTLATALAAAGVQVLLADQV